MSSITCEKFHNIINIKVTFTKSYFYVFNRRMFSGICTNITTALSVTTGLVGLSTAPYSDFLVCSTRSINLLRQSCSMMTTGP